MIGVFKKTFLVILLILSACGGNEEPPKQKEKQHPLWQTQLDALQRAKEVEGMVQQQAEQRRRQINEIEEGRK